MSSTGEKSRLAVLESAGSGLGIVVVDELEKLPKIEDIERVLVAVAGKISEGTKLILEGDSRGYRAAVGLEKFPGIEQFQLGPLAGGDVEGKLLVEPLAGRGIKLNENAARMLMVETSGNPYLIQRLAMELAERPEAAVQVFGRAEMENFLELALEKLADYFNELVHRILWDDKAPYAVIDLMLGQLKEPSDSLRGLGITAPGKTAIVSNFFRGGLKDRCVPAKLARHFAEIGNWGQAVAFYELHLQRWPINKVQEVEVLKALVTACFKAGDALKFTYFAGLVNRHLPQAERSNAAKEWFISRLRELLQHRGEKDNRTVLDAVVQGADAICRTGRCRLYLVDSTGRRLMCRSALGNHAEDFLRDSISLASPDWKIAKVFLNPAVTRIADTHADLECNRIARRRELNSSWLIPVYSPQPTGPAQPSQVCIGVFCVDNPYHCPDHPDEEELTLLQEVLRGVAEPIRLAKQVADRLDVQFRLEQLTSLHTHLLVSHPEESILEDLFRVAKAIQPEIVAIVIRVVTGYYRNRLRYARCWPREVIEPVLKRPDLEIIDQPDTLGAFKEEGGPWLEVPDVNVADPGRPVRAVTRFIAAMREQDPNFSLGSLLSFRIGEGDTFMGICSFYTAFPRSFLEEECRLLAMIVKQAGVALYNSHQIHARERHVRGLQILKECIQLINRREWNPDQLIKKLTQDLGELFRVNDVAYATVLDPGKTYVFKHIWRSDSNAASKEEVFGLDRGITGWAIRDGETKVVTPRDPQWGQYYIERNAGINTCAAIPMRDNSGEVVGALAFEAKQLDLFTPEDVELIETVVSEVPVAIDTAKLLRELTVAKEELEKKGWTEAMGESVASTVHGVASRVGVIPGWVDAIGAALSDLPASLPDIRLKLEQIKASSTDMLSMARRLSRSGKIPEAFTRFSLLELLRDVTEKVLHRLNDPKLEWRLDQTLEVLVLSDPNRVRDIVDNLLENAARASLRAATKRSPVVTAMLRSAREGAATLYVSDTGNGVPPKQALDLCRAMVPSNWGGHGIGLFVGARMARRLGGELRLESSSDCGSVFSFTFPMASGS